MSLKEKEEQEEKIWELYLNCRTQEEIGKVVNLTHQAISKIILQKVAKIPEELQYYNVWKVFSFFITFKKYFISLFSYSKK